MDIEKKYTEIAKSFWDGFINIEARLYKYLLKRDNIHYTKAINMVAGVKSKFNELIDIQFGIDIRNGMMLVERKDNIELIMSPLFQKCNIKLLDILYNEYLTRKLPEYWNVVKYKFHQPQFINTITLNYNKTSDENSDMLEITKDDFCYHSIVDIENLKLSIILFIDDNKSSYLIKKEVYENKKEDIPNRDIWVPKDNGVHAILDAAVGEYNLLNVLDKIEIHLKSDLDGDEFKDITTYKLDNINDEIEMMNSQSLSNTYRCARCYYSSMQVKMCVCQCKKTYYCDAICQKAHRKLHKLSCVK